MSDPEGFHSGEIDRSASRADIGPVGEEGYAKAIVSAFVRLVGAWA